MGDSCTTRLNTLGAGGLETNENILSTLQALVEGTRHLPVDNRLGTFQMLPVHGIHMGSPTPGWVHFKCTLQLSPNLISPTTNPHISTPVQISSICSPTSQAIYIFWVHSKCSQNMWFTYIQNLPTVHSLITIPLFPTNVLPVFPEQRGLNKSYMFCRCSQIEFTILTTTHI